MPSPKPAQIRAARALLGWRQVDLADKSGVSKMTVRFIENGSVSPKVDTMDKIEAAFNAVGVEFRDGGATRAKAATVR